MADLERTEKATPKRRSEARKKGQVAKSREISSVLVLLAGLVALFFLGSYYYQQLSTLMVQFFENAGNFSINPGNIQAMQRQLIGSFLVILSPFLGGGGLFFFGVNQTRSYEGKPNKRVHPLLFPAIPFGITEIFMQDADRRGDSLLYDQKRVA
jgi:flagellar biosynthesis protein FlhB